MGGRNRKKAATQMDGGGDQRGWLALLHPVDPLALLVADGFDREFHLLRDRAGDEAP